MKEIYTTVQKKVWTPENNLYGIAVDLNLKSNVWAEIIVVADKCNHNHN